MLEVAWTTGCTFNDMDEGEAPLAEFFRNIVIKRLRVGLENIVGRRDGGKADAGAARADLFRNRIHDFQQEAGAVFDRTAILIGALVGAGFQELLDQITVGGMDFDAVKTGLKCCARAGAVVLEDKADIVDGQCTRLGGFRKGAGAVIIDDIGLRFGGDGRRGDRLAAMRLERRVGNAPYVPDLRDNLAACRMHAVGDLFPAFDRFLLVEARNIRIALTLLGNRRAFRNDQPGRCTLLVIGGVEVVGNCSRRPVAGEGSHDDTVGECDIAGLCRFEKTCHATSLSCRLANCAGDALSIWCGHRTFRKPNDSFRFDAQVLKLGRLKDWLADNCGSRRWFPRCVRKTPIAQLSSTLSGQPPAEPPDATTRSIATGR